MRCYICDEFGKKTYRDRNDPSRFICGRCYNASSYVGTKTWDLGSHSDISRLLEELEERISGLFNGPECPGDCSCNCTYETGCKLLLDKKKPT